MSKGKGNSGNQGSNRTQGNLEIRSQTVLPPPQSGGNNSGGSNSGGEGTGSGGGGSTSGSGDSGSGNSSGSNK